MAILNAHSKMHYLLEKCRSKKAVLLDLDNTLYAYTPCHEAALKQTWATYHRLIEPLSYRVFKSHYSQAQKQVKKNTSRQAASHSRLLYFQKLIEARRGKTLFKESLFLEKTYWTTFIRQIKVHPWVVPFLRKLKLKGIKVVIVTDLTAQVQFQKLLSMKLGGLIDFVVTSEEAGIEKPDPKIFNLAMKKAGCSAKETLIIGDDPAKDRSSKIPFYLV